MRHFGPIRIKARGLAANEAGRYIPIARLLLGKLKQRMALGGLQYGTWRRLLDDGTLIELISYPVENIVIITPPPTTTSRGAFLELFLESGYSDLDLEDGPFLFYPAKVKASLAEQRVWLDTILFGAEGETWPQHAPRPYSPGMKSVSYNDQEEIAPSKWYSAASGKLKLLLQSWYGTRQEREWEIAIGHEFASTKGLVSLPDLRYYLVDVQAQAKKILGAYLELSAEAQVLRSFFLSTNPDTGGTYWDGLDANERHKIEAYLLGHSTPKAFTPITVSGFDDIAGEPFYYGWKFNWSGLEASVVTSEPKYKLTSGGKPFIEYHISRRYRLTFSEQQPPEDADEPTDAQHVLRADCVKAEEIEYTPRINIDLLWIPFPATNQMITYYWITGPGFADYSDTSQDGYKEVEAPIYCFYDGTDTLRLVKHRLTRIAENHDPDAYDQVVNHVSACDAGSASDSYSGNLAGFSGGFFLASENGQGEPMPYPGAPGAEVHTGDRYSEFAAEASVSGAVTGPSNTLSGSGSGLTPPYNNFDSCTEGFVPGQGGTVTYTGGTTDRYRKYGNISHLYESAAIIPFYSSESVYLGHRENNNDIRTKHEDYINSIHQIEFRRGSTEYPTKIARSAWDMSRLLGGGLPLEGTVITYLGPDYLLQGEGQIVLAHKRGVITTATLDYEFKSTLTENQNYVSKILEEEGRWAALFDPVLFGNDPYPFFDFPFIAKESTLGDLYYFADFQGKDSYDDMIERNDPNLPEPTAKAAINSLFLGWS